MIKGKLNSDDLKEVSRKWEELTVLLNTCGHGPEKTSQQWKKVSLSCISHYSQ